MTQYLLANYHAGVPDRAPEERRQMFADIDALGTMTISAP
jgi:hypothetical protein